MVQRNENWLSHKKKVNEILHTEKYHELRTYEAAFSRMRNNFWTDKIKKSHNIILLCAKKRLFEVHLSYFPYFFIPKLERLDLSSFTWQSFQPFSYHA